MRWTPDAEALMGKVPGFVRSTARRAVEKLAKAEGLDEIDAVTVRRAMPRRGAPKGQALADLVEEAELTAERAAVRTQGYELTVCGGLAGCPLAVGDTEAAFQGVRRVVEDAGLDRAIAGRIDGPVLSHSRCKMTVSACPNGCSEPRNKDVALVARAWPGEHPEVCDRCMACVKACPDGACSVPEGGVEIDWSVCVGCGRCITACRTGGLTEQSSGWDVLAGGRLGRHPRFAQKVNDEPLALDEAVAVVARVLGYLVEYGEPGERLATALDRRGMEDLGSHCRTR